MGFVNYDHKGHFSCILLALESLETVRYETYPLACGEVLEVGDKFTELGIKKSAGHPNIHLAPGWHQRFEGLVTTAHFNRCDTDPLDWVLFSAWHESGASALEGLKMRYPYTFIAYSAFDGGRLHFYTNAVSSRLINCASIKRLF